MNRTVNVVRMQLVNRETFIWIPLMVLGGALVISLAIYWIIASAGGEGPMYGGGAQAPLWYFAVVGAQALTLTFPFSQAMSVTRREFYLGTLLTAGMTGAILAITFVIGGYVEEATGGWGFNGYFFQIPWVLDAGPAGAALFFFALAMLFFGFGFWGATIWKRFGPLGLTMTLIGLAVVIVGLVWLVTRLEAWVSVFTWIVEVGVVGLSLWGLVLLAVLAGTSYLTLRRAVP
ncbi:hypothetical protein [Microbacterium sp. No. 7]|uniref:hypothetical protein n=1 Tax=Microbacterium sp. No. 7 TaxID=1714373 RepID=UPI0006D2A904|nr:hypothetical protein [Microbacterium sp. No. 7]ALJ18519.1 hypothetical protein AOA12_00740 [Microbacterium sp. No. 7]